MMRIVDVVDSVPMMLYVILIMARDRTGNEIHYYCTGTDLLGKNGPHRPWTGTQLKE